MLVAMLDPMVIIKCSRAPCHVVLLLCTVQVIVAEDYSGSADPSEQAMEYYAVAVVDKGMCGSGGMSLASLKGKRSCHTGVRKQHQCGVPHKCADHMRAACVLSVCTR